MPALSSATSIRRTLFCENPESAVISDNRIALPCGITDKTFSAGPCLSMLGSISTSLIYFASKATDAAGTCSAKPTQMSPSLRPSIQGTRIGKAAGAHSRNCPPARRKRAAGEKPTPSYCRILWLTLQSNTLLSGRTLPKRKTLAT